MARDMREVLALLPDRLTTAGHAARALDALYRWADSDDAQLNDEPWRRLLGDGWGPGWGPSQLALMRGIDPQTAPTHERLGAGLLPDRLTGPEYVHPIGRGGGGPAAEGSDPRATQLVARRVLLWRRGAAFRAEAATIAPADRARQLRRDADRLTAAADQLEPAIDATSWEWLATLRTAAGAAAATQPTVRTPQWRPVTLR